MTELLAALSAISDDLKPWLFPAMLVFIRVSAAISVLPALGEQFLPMRVKLAVALALTAVLIPVVVPAPPPAMTITVADILSETVKGLIIGLGFRFFFFGLSFAGTIIANATSLSAMFGITAAEPTPIAANILFLGGLALFFAFDCHIAAVQLLAASYELFPIKTVPPVSELADWAFQMATRITFLAFRISVPFLAASLIFNLALGVINKAMPQLMVSFVGAPAMVLGGTAMMAVALPYGLYVWSRALLDWTANPFWLAP